MSHFVESIAENYGKQSIVEFRQSLRKYSILKRVRFFFFFFFCVQYNIGIKLNIYLHTFNTKNFKKLPKDTSITITFIDMKIEACSLAYLNKTIRS